MHESIPNSQHRRHFHVDFTQAARSAGDGYLSEEPKLPEPQIDPQEVAEAILQAAAHHTRDKKVSTMAVLDTAAAKLVPGIADKLSAKRAEQQRMDMPARDPEGALYRPSEDGRVRGTHAAE